MTQDALRSLGTGDGNHKVRIERAAEVLDARSSGYIARSIIDGSIAIDAIEREYVRAA